MNGIGVYIHVPFCRRKCRYCDFASRPMAEAGEADRFVEAAVRELALRADAGAVAGQSAGTVYFGGGTPSLIGAERIGRLLDAIRGTSAVERDAEVTVEANPLDVTREWAEGCLAAGVNRLSIGVQSIDEDDLRFLGRLHHADDGPRAVGIARAAGFTNIGIDLIYGLPGQTAEALERRVAEAVGACEPEHVSCYQLTYAAGTPLDRDRAAGRVRALSQDEEHGLFVSLHRQLAGLGYAAYEVSNFCRGEAFRSRHNTNYWNHSAYIGLGPSAHSFLPPRRSWNAASVDEYFAAIDEGRLRVAGEECLTQDQLADETVMLALRTTDGLDLGRYREQFGRDFVGRNADAVRNAVEQGWLVQTPTHLRPTPAGLAVADRLAAEFC